MTFPTTSFRPGDLITQNFTLTLSCPQRPGIVHAVTSFLFSRNCDIAEHQQFDDTISQSFFLRTKFICGDEIADVRGADRRSSERSQAISA